MRRAIDLGFRLLVGAGGAATVVVIAALAAVIFLQIAPLAGDPTVAPDGGVDLAAAPLAVTVDEYLQVRGVLAADGFRFESGTLRADDAPIVAAAEGAGGRFLLGLDDGRLLPVTLHYDVEYPPEGRTVTPRLEARDPVRVDGPIRALAFAANDEGWVAAVAGDSVRIVRRRRSRSLMARGKFEDSFATLDVRATGPMAVDGTGQTLYFADADGALVRADVSDEPVVVERVPVEAPITVLAFLGGDRTLLMGRADGDVSAWHLIRDTETTFKLSILHTFEPHAGAVTAISASGRDRGFVSAGADGVVRLHFVTGGSTTAAFDARAVAVRIAPKADAILTAGADGELRQWALENPYPEATAGALFGKVTYEGYSEPVYMWQSTGGSDDFEPKLSLVPLVFGTIKGTIYAMLFAAPLGLMAALYTSQFAGPRFRAWVKPVVEMMAAMPSVILGFIAALWLAPRLERHLLGILLLPATLPVCALVGFGLWKLGRLSPIPALAIGVLAVAAATLGLSAGADLAGSVEYDQRNAVVVGIAMGFAVVPIIFTISEDALSSVPPSLAAAAFALGADRWQTATRVVLPTASPGIFSAVMIGMGRAVGETMIVLMATGNTPIMDWTPFNGFRALSANIAVELPEAPHGGTLFRVLFLCAFLLFVMTFAMNTLAEIVRLRLRKRYQAHA